MMYKICGVILIVLSCGGVGFKAAADHKRKAKLLKELIASIRFMKCELECRCTPLPELCRRVAETCNGHIRKFYLRLSEVLDSQVCPDTLSCCAYTITEIKGLPPCVCETIMIMAATLGKFDLKGQLEGLELAAIQGENALEKLTFEQDNRLRSYQTLGLCAGAALAILLV